MQYALFPYPKKTYHLKRKRAGASQGRTKEGPPLYIPQGKEGLETGLRGPKACLGWFIRFDIQVRLKQ